MILKSIPDLGCPEWAADNCVLLTRMGSYAFGVNGESADHDVVGIVMPPMADMFPQLTGYIPGFDPAPTPFTNWSRHHVRDGAGGMWDVTLHSLVRYVHLLQRGTIGVIEPLFAPDHCVLHVTSVGETLRAYRTEFLHKRSLRWLRHYAAGQIRKIANTTEKASPERQDLIHRFGYDVKDASHVVRLYLQAAQILREGDLTLTANADIMRSIRSGAWTLNDLTTWVDTFERETLLPLLDRSTLREEPTDIVRNLLVTMLRDEAKSDTLAFEIGAFHERCP